MVSVWVPGGWIKRGVGGIRQKGGHVVGGWMVYVISSFADGRRLKMRFCIACARGVVMVMALTGDAAVLDLSVAKVADGLLVGEGPERHAGAAERVPEACMRLKVFGEMLRADPRSA